LQTLLTTGNNLCKEVEIESVSFHGINARIKLTQFMKSCCLTDEGPSSINLRAE
jgi:hypothetical protein